MASPIISVLHAINNEALLNAANLSKILHVLRQTNFDATSATEVADHLRQNIRRDTAILKATGGSPLQPTVYSVEQIREIAER